MVNQHLITVSSRLPRRLRSSRSRLPLPAAASAAAAVMLVLLAGCAGMPAAGHFDPPPQQPPSTPLLPTEPADVAPRTIPAADRLPRPAPPEPVLTAFGQSIPAVQPASLQTDGLPAPERPAMLPAAQRLDLRLPADPARLPTFDPADAVDPVDAVDLVETVDPADPIDSAERTERTDRTDRTESVAPAGQTERARPAGQAAEEAAHPEPVRRAAEQRSEPPPVPSVEQRSEPLVDRRVATVVREEATIRLAGSGWVFLGGRDETTGATDGVTYRRRRSVDGETEFTLRGEEPGSYTLSFQRQDLSRGMVERHSLGLDVTARADRRADPATVRAIETPSIETPPDPSAASDRNPAADPAAGDTIARILSTDNPEQIAVAAQRALLDNRQDLAAELWRRNSQLETPHGREARRGLFDLSFNGARYGEAIERARAMLYHSERPPVESLLRLSDHAFGNDRADDGFDLLQRSLDLTEGRERDGLLFRLAQFYETSAEHRNLRSSLSLYRQVVDHHPLSRYWERSRARIEYLERHFFYLR